MKRTEMSKQLRLHHNMLVRARGKAADGPVWVNAHALTAVDVAEGDDETTPMAFTFRRQPERKADLIRYEHSTGRLFLRVGTVKAAEGQELHWGVDYKYPTYYLNRAADERLRSLQAEGVKVYGARYRESPELKDVVEPNRADVEKAYAELAECAAGWMVMDGYLWRAIPEPMFHVYRTNDGWKTALVTTPDGRIGSDRRHFHFGLGEYAELMSWKAHLSEITNRPSTEDEFVAHDVYAPSLDGYRVDLVFALDDIVSRFAKAADPIWGPGGKALDYVGMPMPLFELFSDTRKLRHEAEVNWTDDLASDIADHLEKVNAFVGENPFYKDLFAKPSETSWQLDRWNSRPVSLVGDFGRGPSL